MFRASYYVTVLVDAPVAGDTFEQAMESAKKKRAQDLVKVKPGVENCDWQIQLYSVNDMAANGEM